MPFRRPNLKIDIQIINESKKQDSGEYGKDNKTPTPPPTGVVGGIGFVCYKNDP